MTASESPDQFMDPGLEAEIADALGDRSIHQIDDEERSGLVEIDADVRTGTVVDVGDSDVLVEFSAREQGVCPIGHFASAPKVGDILPFRIEGHEAQSDLIKLSLGQQASSHVNWADIEFGRVVRAQVTGHNSGGLELKVSGHRAFMPFSQVGLERIEDPEEYVGRALDCEVIELDRARDKVVLSSRAILERQREESRVMMMAGLAVGTVIKGKVSRIEAFGAFVDIGGGMEGLLHVSNMSYQRVEDPNDIVGLGDEIEVQVLSIEEDAQRIGLGTKQLQADPWDEFVAQHSVNSLVPGKVTRIVDFGAFVELMPGVEGLLHISQLAPHRVARVRAVVGEEEELQVRIATIERDRRRIGLSLLTEKGRALGDDSEADDDTMRRYTVQKGEPLDTGGSSLGNLLREALEKKEEEKGI